MGPPINNQDRSRHLGRLPTGESKPLWKPTKEHVRASPKSFTRRHRDGAIGIHEPTLKYTLDEARAIFAEEERTILFTALAKGHNSDRRQPLRTEGGDRNLRAPRKCVSGLNWVSWLSFIPPDWEERW